jgi:membrane-bound ClpP family serine protease
MYNLLSSVHDKLTVEVLGLAASAASVVALAGKELVMAPGTFFMIHNPSVDTQGNSTSLRKDADTLDKIANQILNIYAAHSNLTIDELAKMLEDETWLNADEALKYGFATSVNKELKAVACLYNLDAKGFKHIPRNLARPQVSLNNMDIREFETFLREVVMSRQDATLVASKVGLGKKHESDSPVADEIAVLDEFLKAIKSI